MTNANLSRRTWMKSVAGIGALASMPPRVLAAPPDEGVVDIGSRRELFVDDLLIGSHEGTRLKLHEPQKLRHVPPRPFGHYATVIKDGDRFRMYYRGDNKPGLHWRKDGWGKYHENEVTEYAESRDGLHWTEPDLNLFEVDGIPEGNVVLANEFLVTHNFSPFIDERPGVPAEERFKALGGGRYPDANWRGWPEPGRRAALREKHGPGGLYAFVSADGIHWRKWWKEAVIPEEFGKFDSQNVAFWSTEEDRYVCFFRWMRNGLRSFRRSTSEDFVHWTEPVDMEANEPGEHLYTSGTHPYFRAPHVYVALPTRFQANRSSITDVVFMATRPGSNRYERPFKEAFIRPGLGPKGWGSRSNYVAWHIVPTSDTEMSMYMYGGGQYVLRHDGFVSVHAGYETGDFVTKPFRFDGDRLEVNYATSAAGGVFVEVQDASGRPLEGHTLKDADLLYGDEIDRFVTWKGNPAVGDLAGRSVQLRFRMNEADLYSLRFHGEDA